MRNGVRVRRLGLGVGGGAYGPAALAVRAGATFDDAALAPLAAVPCTPSAPTRDRPPAHLAQIQLLADCKQVCYNIYSIYVVLQEIELYCFLLEDLISLLILF